MAEELGKHTYTPTLKCVGVRMRVCISVLLMNKNTKDF